MAEKEKSREFPVVQEFKTDDAAEGKNLVLHNDEVNTFDFVIECLIKICKHTNEQAEQCTYIVHYKGKCDVKSGSFEELGPMRQALIEKGLNATIE